VCASFIFFTLNTFSLNIHVWSIIFAGLCLEEMVVLFNKQSVSLNFKVSLSFRRYCKTVSSNPWFLLVNSCALFMIKHGYDRFTQRFYLSLHVVFICAFIHITQWNVVAVHRQEHIFFPEDGRVLAILLHESCSNRYFFYFNIFIVW